LSQSTRLKDRRTDGQNSHRLTGSVSECLTAGMPNDCIDNHVTLPTDS